MIGGFGALTVFLVLPGGTSLWLALPVMIVGGVIASVLVATGAERFAYRPLRNAPRLAPLITAIGLSIALQQTVWAFYPEAKKSRTFPQFHGAAFDLRHPPPAAQRPLPADRRTTVHDHPGRLRPPHPHRPRHAGHRQDPDTAKLMGINTDRIIVIAFALGAAFAAIAASPTACASARSTSRWASSRPQASPQPSSAASATSTAPCSAASSSA